MSGLLKAGQAECDIRTFAASRPPTQPSAPARSVVEHALDDARKEIARLQAQLIEACAAAERDSSEAYKAGVADGHLAADDATAERLKRLDATLHAARADWNVRLTELDALAVHLARAALAKLFAESTDIGDLVARAIALKLATLRSESVVAIIVSERDFSDQASRDVLRTRTSGDGVLFSSDPALPAGSCRLDLKLGHIDLSVATLANEVDDALAGLVRVGADA